MTPTRAAVLTGDGLGAVAVVRVWGPDALTIVDRGFRPARPSRLVETPPLLPRLGRFGAGIGDEVVVVVFEGDPPDVEIQCHGGPAAIGLVMDGLRSMGVERATADHWVRQSSPSRLRAEATIDLARAETLRTASHLLDQARGAIDRELASIRAMLLDDPAGAIGRIDAMLAMAPLGLRLTRGWRVVLAGRPNVGKSSLMNALAGFERAIVDPTPGTTRDLVTHRTAFDGWPVELTDTAGLRDTADPIEAAGVARAESRQSVADLVVVVLDRSTPLAPQDHRLIATHPDAIVVANKSDLPAAWNSPAPDVSASRGDGIADLAAAIGRRLVPEPPDMGRPIPFRPRQIRGLCILRRLIARGAIDAARIGLGRAAR